MCVCIPVVLIEFGVLVARMVVHCSNRFRVVDGFSRQRERRPVSKLFPDCSEEKQTECPSICDAIGNWQNQFANVMSNEGLTIQVCGLFWNEWLLKGCTDVESLGKELRFKIHFIGNQKL